MPANEPRQGAVPLGSARSQVNSDAALRHARDWRMDGDRDRPEAMRRFLLLPLLAGRRRAGRFRSRRAERLARLPLRMAGRGQCSAAPTRHAPGGPGARPSPGAFLCRGKPAAGAPESFRFPAARLQQELEDRGHQRAADQPHRRSRRLHRRRPIPTAPISASSGTAPPIAPCRSRRCWGPALLRRLRPRFCAALNAQRAENRGEPIRPDPQDPFTTCPAFAELVLAPADGNHNRRFERLDVLDRAVSRRRLCRRQLRGRAAPRRGRCRRDAAGLAGLGSKPPGDDADRACRSRLGPTSRFPGTMRSSSSLIPGRPRSSGSRG